MGARGKMEMEKIPKAGYDIKGITIAGFNRSSLFKNISLPWKLVKSYFQVKKILKDFHPDAVFGVGGYSSLPVVRIAQSQRIPTFIHESNSLPGKSNKILGRKAVKIFVATSGMEKYFPAEKLVVSGNPVRENLQVKHDKKEALQYFGLQDTQKTVLVSGGSLGAKSINDAIAANVDQFKKNSLQLIWQTGKNYASEAANHEEESNNIWTHAFINRMELAYAASDVVVARAGALTLAELCVQGKASILVPFPFAAEDHQTVNAMALVNQDAAIHIPNSKVDELLMPALLGLLSDADRMKKLEKNISQLGTRNADEIIAREILNHLES